MEGKLSGTPFQATLEPDGQLSHWLRVDKELLAASKVDFGEIVTVAILPVQQEPEPAVPPDFHKALSAAPEARSTWDQTTTLARLDWVHWIESATQVKTRMKRINDACNMLSGGKKRVCCFDQSGFYSKALHAPKEAI